MTQCVLVIYIISAFSFQQAYYKALNLRPVFPTKTYTSIFSYILGIDHSYHALKILMILKAL